MTMIPPTLPYQSRTAIPLAVLIVATAASLANALIALGATSAGAEATDGLEPGAYVTFTVVAAIAGALGWHAINRRARHPARVMRWLVPAFLIVSFIPDLGFVATMGWVFAAGLMLMHVATAAIAVTTYRRLMPLRA
jgi:hypothetical protein